MTLDDPMDLLLACHDKVRHFATLAEKLVAHLAHHGADESAISAARAIIRYFDIAAPLHHDDEELDLFPALAELPDPGLRQSLARLGNEHAQLNEAWQHMRSWLANIKLGQAREPGAVVLDFVQAYRRHAHDEETLVYPSARQLSPAQLANISAAMVKRRSTP